MRLDGETGSFYPLPTLPHAAAEGGRRMLTVVIQVNAPDWAAQAVKEHLAMVLEPFGDSRVVEVKSDG